MERGKELKIESAKNHNVVFGTVDNKNPKSLYVNICAWGNPQLKENNIDYAKVVRDLHKKIKQDLYNNINEAYFDKDKVIVDFDMRDSGIRYGKQSYMSCEINLCQNKNLSLSSIDLCNALTGVLNIVTYNTLDDNKYFSYTKNKK